MHLHLLIPDLLLPVDTGNAAWGEARSVLPQLDALETLLAKGRRTPSPALQMERWLLQRFGASSGDQAHGDDDADVTTGDSTGAAAYSFAGDDGDPGAATWVRADPVHLRVEGDELVLADAGVFGIDNDEASALAAALNEHFGAALQIDARRPERWYARLATMPKMRTTPLGEARGEPISGHLPSGEDGMQWHALMNEVQMALHEHPVNEAREARGELPVNSLWFWGHGVYAPLEHRPFNAVLADDPLARGLASASGAAASALPDSLKSWLANAPDEGQTLVVLDALRSAARYGDSHGWATAGAELHRDWIAPALEALRSGRIGMLTVHLPTALGGLSVENIRGDLRRFWRRRKPLAAYVPRSKAPQARD
jgi:hypothetical protein